MSTSKITGSNITLLIAEPRNINSKKDDPAQDSVTLSSSGSLLEQAADKAMASSGIDMDKVNTVRQAIANGSLKIDTEQLAQKMLAFESDIFGIDTE